MASNRSYHAFIRAARKDGGLSLPAARKVYRKVSERLGVPAKAVDVKRHPRIFKESLLKRDRDRLNREREEKRRANARRKRERERKEREKEKPRKRVIESFDDFEEMEDYFLDEDIEYASTAEY